MEIGQGFFVQFDAIDSKTSKQTIKNLFNVGYVEEQSYLLWIQVLEDRNTLSHRYDEQAYQKVQGRMKIYVIFYLELFEINMSKAGSSKFG